MKKIISLLTFITFGSLTFAEPIQNQVLPNLNVPQQKAAETQQEETETPEPEIPQEVVEEPIQNPDLTVVEKGNQKFYYDKYGKFIARDKKVNGQIFFYNKTGQLVGKSVERNDKNYYYNGLNKFLGYCNEKECFDEELNSTGKVPPLPKINEFKAVIDDNIINPSAKEDSGKKEED